jgi:hypothetical protein
MVEFLDPLTNENRTYYISKILSEKWDKLRNGELQKKDEDRVYLVDGRERVGKSLFTFQQAKYLDPTFNIKRICFTPEEFLDQIRNAPQGSCVVFDEAFRGLSSKATQSKVNKKVVQAMMEVGQRNLIIFIVLPTFFLLELYAAVLRSNALFHIYKDKNGRRRFRLYNFQAKSLLYRNGKKKGFDYSWPRVKLRDRFYGVWPIDEEKYKKKKLSSLKEFETEEELSKSQENVQERTIKIINKIKKDNPKINYRGIMVELKEEYGIDKSLAYIGKLVRLAREKQPNTEE